MTNNKNIKMVDPYFYQDDVMEMFLIFSPEMKDNIC